ncbi:kinase-like domain-containing protein, partial [Schizophyllum fasciatum]
MTTYNDVFKAFPGARFAWNDCDRIGSGSNGVVTRATDLHTGRVIALKFQHRDRRPGAPVLRQQKNEHAIHATLSNHPHIVTLIDTFITDDHVITAMSLCNGGDLFAAIFKDHFRLRVDDLQDGFLQLISALSYMHDNGLYHRDLKLENILLSADMQTWKIADFGWATTNELTESPGLGSTFYRSPEILRGHYYNRDADIYALGMIIFVAVAQSKPWAQPSRRD